MEQILRLIAKAKRTRATSLHLVDCRLTELPEELLELVWLEKLILSHNNKLVDLSPLAGLTNLKQLNVSYTKVSDLSPLAGLTNLKQLNVSYTKVSDLNPLVGLTNLQDFEVSHTKVSDLSPLVGLTNLEKIQVNYTQIYDLSPLVGLINLQQLNVNNAHVSDLSFLSSFAKLQQLDVSYNQINDLSPLVGLTNLQKLNVSYTQVSDLSPLQGLINIAQLILTQSNVCDLSPLIGIMYRLKVICSLWYSDDAIYVEGCPLGNPPVEIAKQGREAILRYFDEQKRAGTIVLNEARLLIVGQAGAGKTSLRTKLMNSSAALPTLELTTRGIDIEVLPFVTENGLFELRIWDFGGQNIQHYAHQFFLSDSVVYALVRDERKEDGGMSYWLNIISLLGKDSPVIIVQNQKEGHSEDIKELAAIRKAFPKVQEPIKIDLLRAGEDGYRPYQDLRKEVCHLASKLPHVGRSYAKSYKLLQSSLEALSEKQKFCKFGEFIGLCKEQGIENEETMKDFLRSYHQLGVALWFEHDIDLESYVFLSPKWIIDALFKLLYDGQQRREEAIIDVFAVKSIWKGDEYEGMRGTLLKLMKNFEMCYEMPNEHYLIPQNQPPCNIDIRESKNATKVLFEYEFLPKGFLTRLTCRLHHRIHNQNVWNNAVIFGEGDSTTVLAYETYEKNVIELIAEGNGKAQLLNEAVRLLDAIHRESKFSNLQVKKRIPCPCAVCKTKEKPYFFNYEFLQGKLERGAKKAECQNLYGDVLISEILREIQIFSRDQIIDYLAADKIKDALELLMIEYGDKNELVEVTRQLNEAHGNYLLGSSTFEEYRATKARLVRFIMEIMK